MGEMLNRSRDRAGGVSLGRAVKVGGVALRAINIACCLAATVWLASIATPVCARPLSDTLVANDDEDRWPSREAARRAFDQVRSWADVLEAPPLDAAASRSVLEGATGVHVLLRRAGRVVGMASESSGSKVGGAGVGAGDDLTLRRAAGRALNAALGEEALQRLLAQIRQDHADPEEAENAVNDLLREVGGSLLVEIELAGTPQPLVGRTVEQLASKLEPGLDGVALRRGEAWHFAFPSELRATNSAGDRQQAIISLALSAGLEVSEIAALGARDDVSVYRFRTVHLAQRAQGGEPVELFRGDEIVPQSAVTRASIAALADGIAAHLIVSLFPELPADEARRDPALELAPQPLGLMGDYQIVSDTYRPLIAPPLDQALAAWSLLRYGRSPLIDNAAATKASAAAVRILRELEAVAPGEDDPRDDPAACAAIILAIAERPDVRRDEAIARLAGAAARLVHESFDPAAGFRLKAEGDRPARQIAASAQPLIAAAQAKLLLLKLSGDDAGADAGLDRAQVRRALDAAWRSVPEPQRIALLPWIGWAEVDYAKASGEPLAHVEDLRMLLDLLDAIRIGDAGPETDAPSVAPPPDLHGGFALSGGAAGLGGAGTATSQTLRPAAWVAEAIGNTRIVPPEQAQAALNAHLRTMRFVMQLAVGPDDAGSLRNPARALGGIRMAPWDSQQPIPAQALGLVTAVKTLEQVAASEPPSPRLPSAP